ncbi:MAG: RecQ family ATP-dependent DNA helicase [Gaiellaceae bacterium]
MSSPDFSGETTASEQEAPLCPKGHGPMQLRTARRGANRGGLFWGCSVYPVCKEAFSYESGDGAAAPVTEIDLGPAPSCPEQGCGETMVLKTAHRGRYRGSQFWSCPRFPDCKGMVNIGDGADGAAPATRASASDGADAALVTRRVLWADAATDRAGWTCRYTTAGGSLRALGASGELAAAAMSQCWIARSDALPDVGADVERLVGLLRKLLQRGSAPPLHPQAERRLLESVGLSAEVEASSMPGDLSVRLRRRLDRIELRNAAWSTREVTLDPSIAFGSDEERTFLVDWVPRALGSAAARWFTPQAPLDALVAAAGLPAAGQRRVDFLVAPPWQKPFVVEIDGRQHDEAELVDDGRDELLTAAGYDVVRIGADEVRAGVGFGLDELVARWEAPPHQGGTAHRLLAVAPAQTHRLVLALLEALAAGYLGRERWVIEVRDTLEIALELLPAYLDLFAAADVLWGGGVLPNEILVGNATGWQQYERNDEGYSVSGVSGEVGELDVLIRLEVGASPLEDLRAESSGPEVVVRDAHLPVAVADPVYEGAGRIAVQTEGEEIEWALRVMLQAIFAKEDFREGQLDALFEVIEGRDCAVLLPTGAGKSLIYQLAGLVLPGRTLIVDPLVALMEDQVEGLRSHGIDRVAAISSFTTQQGQREALLEQVASGHALFVFVAPERMQQKAFRSALRALSHTSLVNLAVVDEAHCVSEWGHDFRTSYLNLGRTLRDVCRDAAGMPPPILALTGTASRAVLRDVLIELEIERDSERSVVRPRSFDRAELRFNIIRAEPSEADAALTGFLRSLPAKFNVPAGDFFRPREERTYSGVVFCPWVNGEYGIVHVRRHLAPVVGTEPAMYSGSAPRGFEDDWEEVKRSHASAFKSNASPLLVSTKAFGMGIDKGNIRYVLHYGIPGSIEGYYQEVGRAGRDRQRAECGLVLVEYDEARARRLLSEDVDLEQARSAYADVNRKDGDDITRQLFFHLRSFRGIARELEALDATIQQLDRLGRRGSVDMPMAPNASETRRGQPEPVLTRESQERALHRLVVLGVVRDYLVEWGARIFPVELAEIDSAGVVERLIGYVRRNQPGRVEAIRARAVGVTEKPLDEVVLECARSLIEFVYDTVERSRRRSLREMWLAAREANGDGNGVFRQRILDYLSQGAIAPTLERLVDQPSFSYTDWIDELIQIEAVDDAREMRGDSARLLSSYPDHPGLLLARGLSEALDDRGDLREFSSNVEASLRSAVERYGVSPAAQTQLGTWLLTFCAKRRDGALAAAMAVIERAGFATGDVRKWHLEALTTAGGDVGVRVLALATMLEDANRVLDQVTRNYEGDLQ